MLDYAGDLRVLQHRVLAATGEAPATGLCELERMAGFRADCLTAVYMERAVDTISAKLETWVQVLMIAGGLFSVCGFGVCLWLVFGRRDKRELII